MFDRILLALDSSDSGPVAASFAVALARSWGASVHVVHINEYVSGGRDLTCESPAEAAGVVARALAELRDAGVSATGATYQGRAFDVPAALTDLAERYRADVIVLGSRRHRFRLFRGTRERVARRSQLPVVTAPAPLRVPARDPALQGTPTPPRTVGAPD
jgi:nucleotide-binding universal stress UspA family protein